MNRPGRQTFLVATLCIEFKELNGLLKLAHDKTRQNKVKQVGDSADNKGNLE